MDGWMDKYYFCTLRFVLNRKTTKERRVILSEVICSFYQVISTGRTETFGQMGSSPDPLDHTYENHVKPCTTAGQKYCFCLSEIFFAKLKWPFDQENPIERFAIKFTLYTVLFFSNIWNILAAQVFCQLFFLLHTLRTERLLKLRNRLTEL